MYKEKAIEEIKLIYPDVSREIIKKLSLYVEYLIKWNKNINLISKETEPDIWIRHVLDSAQLIKFITDSSQTLVDLGSGAGLPGIILSILGIKKVILIESDTKKCSFLTEVSRILELSTEIVNDRIENIKLNADLLVARGLSRLDLLFYVTQNLTCDRMLLLKGENIDREIMEAETKWVFQYTKHESITKIESYILDITNVHKKN